jgi:hypothetical protein
LLFYFCANNVGKIDVSTQAKPTYQAISRRGGVVTLKTTIFKMIKGPLTSRLVPVCVTANNFENCNLFFSLNG